MFMCNVHTRIRIYSSFYLFHFLGPLLALRIGMSLAEAMPVFLLFVCLLNENKLKKEGSEKNRSENAQIRKRPRMVKLSSKTILRDAFCLLLFSPCGSIPKSTVAPRQKQPHVHCICAELLLYSAFFSSF